MASQPLRYDSVATCDGPGAVRGSGAGSSDFTSKTNGMSSRCRIENQLAGDRPAFDQRLKQSRLDRGVFVPATQDVNAVRVLAPDERDVPHGGAGGVAGGLASERLSDRLPTLSILPRPSVKRPKRSPTASTNLCTYGVRGRLPTPSKSMSASSNNSDETRRWRGQFRPRHHRRRPGEQPARRPRRDAVFRPSRTAICTSATPRRSASTSAWPQEFGGTCNLRFDDTNPTTEDVEYVEAIQDDIRWLGFEWVERCSTRRTTSRSSTSWR